MLYWEEKVLKKETPIRIWKRKQSFSDCYFLIFEESNLYKANYEGE